MLVVSDGNILSSQPFNEVHNLAALVTILGTELKLSVGEFGNFCKLGHFKTCFYQPSVHCALAIN